jgi:hypothetical protein
VASTPVSIRHQKTMLASFVICFHTARISNLLQTLRFLVRDHQEVVSDCFLSLACQDCEQNLQKTDFLELNELRSRFADGILLNAQLKEMELPNLTNQAVAASPTEKLVILESDRLLPRGYFAEVIGGLEKETQVTCKKMIKLNREMNDESIISRNFEFKEEFRDERNRPGFRNIWSGNTIISKTDYERAGKMDEHYCGYGWADSDMTNRTESVGVRSIYRDEIEIHLWHPSQTYGELDQKSLFVKNGLYFCKKWGENLPDWFRKDVASQRKTIL